MKKIILSIVFAGLVFGSWQAKLAWEAFKPMLAELEKKNPEKYLKLVEEAKSFHIEEVQRLYDEIDSMSREDVIILRHQNWLEKTKNDKKFHEKYYDDELLNRIEIRKTFLKDYELRAEELRKLNEVKPDRDRFEGWKKTEPWKQRLILNEKCVKYVKKEIRYQEIFQKGIEVSKVSTLLAQLSNKPLPVEVLCNNLVPKGQYTKKTEDMVLKLKKTLSYNYYIQLLEEVGIPKGEILQFDDELKERVRGFNDF